MPVKLGLETVPVALPVTLIVPSVPVKEAEVGTAIFPVTKRTPVPVKVGLETVPAGVVVPDTVALPLEKVG